MSQESRRWRVWAQEKCPSTPSTFLPKSSQVSWDRQTNKIKKILQVKALLLERTSGPHCQVDFCHIFGREIAAENQHLLFCRHALNRVSLSLSLFPVFAGTVENPIPFDSCLLHHVLTVWRKDELHTQTKYVPLDSPWPGRHSPHTGSPVA